MEKKYKCVCCGNYTMDHSDPIYYDICRVCFWENDPIQNENKDRKGGANKVSLDEARENYAKFGISDVSLIKAREQLKNYDV